MLDIYERLGTHCHDPVYTTVTLTHEQRDRGRLKLVGDNNEEVRVFLKLVITWAIVTPKSKLANAGCVLNLITF
jgi:hypothetical protein